MVFIISGVASAKRAGAFREWDTASTLVAIVALSAVGPQAVAQFFGGVSRQQDRLGDSHNVLTSWAAALGTISTAGVLAFAVWRFITDVLIKKNPLNLPAAIGTGLALDLVAGDFLAGRTNISNKELALVAILLATTWIQPGRGVLLGGAAVGCSLIVSTCLLGLTNPAAATSVCGDKCTYLKLLVNGPYYSPNELGLALALSIPCLAVVLTTRYAAISAGLCACALIYATGSRSALFAAVLAYAGLWGVRTRLHNYRMPAAHTMLLSSSIVVVGFSLPWLRLSRASYTGRASLWLIARARLSSATTSERTLGFGSKAWKLLYEQSAGIPAAGTYSVHNQWLDMYISGGLVGLGLLVLLGTLLCGHGRRNRRALSYYLLLPGLALSVLERPWSFAELDWLTWGLVVILANPYLSAPKALVLSPLRVASYSVNHRSNFLSRS
jgi:hypothetical protein